MPKLKILFLSLICAAIAFGNCQTAEQKCPLSSGDVDRTIIDNNILSCLQKALQNGWEDVFSYLINQKEPDYQQQFIDIFQKEIKRLQILEEEIVLGQSETEPILKWGQNKTHVFITFKLSHRWDSPPCLYSQSEKTHLENQRFQYENVCLVSHQKISFKVNLNLYKDVFLSLKDSSLQQNTTSNFTDYVFEVKKDGVGTYSTILLKKVAQIWIFLTKEMKSMPTWYQIQARYEQDFKEYEQSLHTYRAVQKQKLSSSPSLYQSVSQWIWKSTRKLISLLSN